MAQPSTKLSLPPTSLHLLSGALSGLASCVALQPCDLLKTRLQQAHLQPSHLPSLSVFQLTSHVVSRDGVLGLWRGTAPTILRNVPGIAVYFFSLAQLRSTMSTVALFSHPPPIVRASLQPAAVHRSTQEDPLPRAQNSTVLPTLTPTGDFFAGVLARTAVGFVLMPITVVKTRFESNLYDYRSVRGAFRDVVTRHGVRGLWRGFVPTVLRDAPFAGVFVSTYEACKRVLEPLQRNHAVLSTHAIPAITAAVVATLVTAPFDLVKTDLQLRNSSHLRNTSPVLDSLRQILDGRVSNFTLLFKGSGLRLLRKSLSSAIGWTI